MNPHRSGEPIGIACAIMDEQDTHTHRNIRETPHDPPPHDLPIYTSEGWQNFPQGFYIMRPDQASTSYPDPEHALLSSMDSSLSSMNIVKLEDVSQSHAFRWPSSPDNSLYDQWSLSGTDVGSRFELPQKASSVIPAQDEHIDAHLSSIHAAPLSSVGTATESHGGRSDPQSRNSTIPTSLGIMVHPSATKKVCQIDHHAQGGRGGKSKAERHFWLHHRPDVFERTNSRIPCPIPGCLHKIPYFRFAERIDEHIMGKHHDWFPDMLPAEGWELVKEFTAPHKKRNKSNLVIHTTAIRSIMASDGLGWVQNQKEFCPSSSMISRGVEFHDRTASRDEHAGGLPRDRPPIPITPCGAHHGAVDMLPAPRRMRGSHSESQAAMQAWNSYDLVDNEPARRDWTRGSKNGHMKYK